MSKYLSCHPERLAKDPENKSFQQRDSSLPQNDRKYMVYKQAQVISGLRKAVKCLQQDFNIYINKAIQFYTERVLLKVEDLYRGYGKFVIMTNQNIV